jgi:hypothetical protein
MTPDLTLLKKIKTQLLPLILSGDEEAKRRYGIVMTAIWNLERNARLPPSGGCSREASS